MSREVLLLRHGMTAGNRMRQYIGSTDEPLCPEGKAALRKSDFPADVVYISNMHRCRETAEILFPGMALTEVPALREMDFGIFEGKCYEDLKDDPDYQGWLDSGGEADIPGGESRGRFCLRCVAGFRGCMAAESSEKTAFVIHGGSIMAILSALAIPHKDYYDWQVSNGRGFLCRWDGVHLHLLKEV